MLDTTRDALLLMSGDAGLWQIIWISLKTSGLALLRATQLAVAIAYGIAMHRFPGRRVLVWLSQAALSLPKVLRQLQGDVHLPRRAG